MLTNTKIQRLKTPSKLERHLDSDGLYIEVSKSGSKNWRYRYKNHTGSWTIKALGSYPKASLEKARELRDDLEMVVEYKCISFKETASEWLIYKGYTSYKNKHLVHRRIENYLLPTLGNMTIANIKPKAILPILKQIAAKEHLELARRIQNILSQIFKYGVQNLYCESNPAQPLQGCTKKPQIKYMPAIIEDADNLMASVKLCLNLAPFVLLTSS